MSLVLACYVALKCFKCGFIVTMFDTSSYSSNAPIMALR